MRTQLSKLLLLLAVISMAVLAYTTVEFQQFESSTLPSGNWIIGSQGGGSVSISTSTSLNYNSSAGSVKGSYPTAANPGDTYVYGAYDISALNTEDVYIEFWAKMPGAKHGLKFLKIFGYNPADTGGAQNGANTTFGLDYTGLDNGQLYYISYGDGTTTTNDTQNGIWLDGTNTVLVGRSFGTTASVSTPQNAAWASSNWGTTWHHFKMHAKFNSGTSALNEVADGAYYLEIDGVVYVDASGLFNRHYSNGTINRIEIFGYTQAGAAPFEIWYDDINITTGGFATSSGDATATITAITLTSPTVNAISGATGGASAAPTSITLGAATVNTLTGATASATATPTALTIAAPSITQITATGNTVPPLLGDKIPSKRGPVHNVRHGRQ